MKMVRYRFCAVVLVLAFAVFALVPCGAQPLPGSLSFDSVCDGLMAHTVTTGSFLQTKTVPSLPKPLVSSGTFIFSESGIAWNSKKPFVSSLVVTKTQMIQIGPNGKKNVIDGVSNQIFSNIAETLSSLFSGNKTALQKNFNVDFSAHDSRWSMALTPKDASIATFMQHVTLSGSATSFSTSLDSIAVQDTNGGTLTYEFSDQLYKETLTDEEKTYFAIK